MKQLRALLVFAVLGAATASEPNSTIASAVARSMSILGVTLEKTTMVEVQHALGPAVITEYGSGGGDGGNVMCFAGSDGTTLVFASNFDMGGGTTITRYELLARERLANYSEDPEHRVPASKRPRCARLKTLSRSTTTGAGVALGLSRAVVRRVLGKPSKTGRGFEEYGSMEKLPMTPADVETMTREFHSRPSAEESFWDRWRWVRVEYLNGRVQAVRAGQTTSY